MRKNFVIRVELVAKAKGISASQNENADLSNIKLGKVLQNDNAGIIEGNNVCPCGNVKSNDNGQQGNIYHKPFLTSNNVTIEENYMTLIESKKN